MLQVAHLVEEAVQAQMVLMVENRRDVHRGAQAGPDFGSMVYGTTQEALAFIPPAEAPRAYAAASGHAASASGVPYCCLACGSVFSKPVMLRCDARACGGGSRSDITADHRAMSHTDCTKCKNVSAA